MAQLEISEVERAGPENELVVLALKGEIDPQTVSELKSQLHRFLEERVRYVVLDMATTSYVNSSALAVLVKFAKAFRDRGGQVAIAEVNERVRLPFEMLGLLVFFKLYDSVAMAKAAIVEGA